MDPRLWQLVDLPPGDLYVRHVQLDHETGTLALECEVFYPDYGDSQTFQLRFKKCRGIRWEAMDTDAGEAAAHALGIYLGEQSHTKPAVVYTGANEMSVLYQEVDVLRR